MLGLWDWNIKKKNIINVNTISLFLDSVAVKAVTFFKVAREFNLIRVLYKVKP